MKGTEMDYSFEIEVLETSKEDWVKSRILSEIYNDIRAAAYIPLGIEAVRTVEVTYWVRLRKWEPKQEPAREIEIFYPDSDGISITVPLQLLPAFKELVFRATNLWPDAPPEIKEFADLLTHGKILQDYKGQDTSKKR